MPRSWYDRHAISREVSEDEQHIYRSVVADRKPYFMRYIYPALSKQYNTYVKAANKNALREFDMTIPEMLERTASSLTEQQLAFIQKYWRYMPVGISNCVMNTICRKIETQFRLLVAENSKRMFDYKMLKSGSDYSSAHLSAIRQIMNEYNKKVQAYAVEANCVRPDEDEKRASLANLDRWFMEKCIQTCPDSEELCDIVLDLCYSREKTKQFAWKMCGDIIVRNLARRKRSISFPRLDERGNIKWKSERFSIASVPVDVIE